MSVGRCIAYGGFLLALVMIVLCIIGTTNGALYYMWCALMLVGAGMGALGRRLDSDTAARRVNQTRLRD